MLGGGLGLNADSSARLRIGHQFIMAGAVLNCLSQMVGIHSKGVNCLTRSCTEQMLTTGGGWQDQVGGLVGGIKLVSTGPGLPQKIHVEQTRLARRPK
jgi:fucokinase